MTIIISITTMTIIMLTMTTTGILYKDNPFEGIKLGREKGGKGVAESSDTDIMMMFGQDTKTRQNHITHENLTQNHTVIPTIQFQSLAGDKREGGEGVILIC